MPVKLGFSNVWMSWRRPSTVSRSVPSRLLPTLVRGEISRLFNVSILIRASGTFMGVDSSLIRLASNSSGDLYTSPVGETGIGVKLTVCGTAETPGVYPSKRSLSNGISACPCWYSVGCTCCCCASCSATLRFGLTAPCGTDCPNKSPVAICCCASCWASANSVACCCWITAACLASSALANSFLAVKPCDAPPTVPNTPPPIAPLTNDSL